LAKRSARAETAAKLLRKRLFNAQHNGKDFVIEGAGSKSMDADSVDD